MLPSQFIHRNRQDFSGASDKSRGRVLGSSLVVISMGNETPTRLGQLSLSQPAALRSCAKARPKGGASPKGGRPAMPHYSKIQTGCHRMFACINY